MSIASEHPARHGMLPLLTSMLGTRIELVAPSVTTKGLIPRARRVAHWIRAMTRLLRVVSASMSAARGPIDRPRPTAI
jgi:hypothetical protein